MLAGADVFVYLSLTFLLGVCSVMTYMQTSKYFAAQSTVAHHVDDTQAALDFPSVSVCPGFKTKIAKKLVWPIHMWEHVPGEEEEDYSDTFPTNKEEMERLWEEITFSPSEILIGIGSDFNENHTVTERIYYNPDKLLAEGRIGCLSMEQVDTITGRCYTITTWCKAAARQNMRLTLNFSQVDEVEVPLTLHHPRDLRGNNLNFFSWPVLFANIHRDSMIDLVLSAKVRVKQEGASKSASEADYFDCVDEAEYKFSLDKVDYSCFFPSLRSAWGNLSDVAKPCKAEPEYRGSVFLSLAALTIRYRDHSCLLPARVSSYDMAMREHRQIAYVGERSDVYINFDNTEVTVEEEYTLQDVYAMVATVGGSVGIFLGWSALDLARIVARGGRFVWGPNGVGGRIKGTIMPGSGKRNILDKL